MSIHGEAADGFEPVREAFEAHKSELQGGGAAIAAYLGGRKIVDLWAGEAAPGAPWRRDTTGAFYSASKVAPAVVAMLVYERGLFDLDAPVAKYWPEFAANGKAGITVRQLLAMQTGFPYTPGHEDALNYGDTLEHLESLMAEAAPILKIGTPAYAAANFGCMVNAVIRRVTGSQLKDIWNDEIARPLGADVWLGGPDQALARMAKLIGSSDENFERLAAFGSEPSHLRMGYASADMVGTADGMARIYAMLVNGGTLDGVKILSPGTIRTFTVIQSREPDAIYSILGDTRPASWMLGGIEGNRTMSPGAPMLYGPNPNSYGKGGAGGQNGLADPDRGLAVGFVRSYLTHKSFLASPLIDALYECLDINAVPSSRTSNAPAPAAR